MRDFTFHNPTKIIFGKDTITKLARELRPYQRILLAYGGGSIKTNGIYDRVVEILNAEGKDFVELSGIMPNPRKEKVYEGIDLCKEHELDFILAVGGGSVIDASKLIASGSRTDRDFWQAFMLNNEEVYDALPLGSILTLPGTGSEMNTGGVITDWENNRKIGFLSPLQFPKFSILDPTYTFTLPREQMVYGMVDALSHIFEQYFSKPDESNVSDDLAETLIKSIIANLNVALADPLDYNARSNMIWLATLALNGLIRLGKDGDWMTHGIEHALSAFYDIPHAAGLAIVHPNYHKYVAKNAPEKFARYARNVWDIDAAGKSDYEVALLGIERTREYFRSIGAPTTLQEVSIPAESIDEIAETVEVYKTSYGGDLTTDDIKNILRMCLE